MSAYDDLEIKCFVDATEDLHHAMLSGQCAKQPSALARALGEMAHVAEMLCEVDTALQLRDIAQAVEKVDFAATEKLHTLEDQVEELLDEDHLDCGCIEDAIEGRWVPVPDEMSPVHARSLLEAEAQKRKAVPDEVVFRGEEKLIEAAQRRPILDPRKQRVVWARLTTIKQLLIKRQLTTHEEFEEMAASMVRDIDNKVLENLRKELGAEEDT